MATGMRPLLAHVPFTSACFPGCPGCLRADTVRAFDELLGDTSSFPTAPLQEVLNNDAAVKRTRKHLQGGAHNSGTAAQRVRINKRARTAANAPRAVLCGPVNAHAAVVEVNNKKAAEEDEEERAYRVLVMRADKWNGAPPPSEPKTSSDAATTPEERETWWSGVVASYRKEGAEVRGCKLTTSHIGMWLKIAFLWFSSGC